LVEGSKGEQEEREETKKQLSSMKIMQRPKNKSQQKTEKVRENKSPRKTNPSAGCQNQTKPKNGENERFNPSAQTKQTND
jgi:hypothetical protein